MDCKVLINGYDLQESFGVVLEDGGLDRFEKPAIPKEPFFNEWHGVSGRDYDDSAEQSYQAQTFEVPFLIVGNSMMDYRQKKYDFMELIDFNGEFDFQIVDWGEAFKLRYKEATVWDLVNSNLEGETSARFVLKLECNFKAAYVFKYLADNDGRHIVANDGTKIMVKSIYNSRYVR